MKIFDRALRAVIWKVFHTPGWTEVKISLGVVSHQYIYSSALQQMNQNLWTNQCIYQQLFNLVEHSLCLFYIISPVGKQQNFFLWLHQRFDMYFRQHSFAKKNFPYQPVFSPISVFISPGSADRKSKRKVAAALPEREQFPNKTDRRWVLPTTLCLCIRFAQSTCTWNPIKLS